MPLARVYNHVETVDRPWPGGRDLGPAQPWILRRRRRRSMWVDDGSPEPPLQRRPYNPFGAARDVPPPDGGGGEGDDGRGRDDPARDDEQQPPPQPAGDNNRPQARGRQGGEEWFFPRDLMRERRGDRRPPPLVLEPYPGIQPTPHLVGCVAMEQKPEPQPTTDDHRAHVRVHVLGVVAGEHEGPHGRSLNA
ncbi:hypothetical protein PV08_00517 [Exophiala spinifera]|uniref:Uncharacterized protein n=1 Tax=Exophiala spinifera TaxID=91928 RepID=A0A0D2A581_9EURO|nr:uncharacterized protein PV08_00517 [Exophiala spinifera]KIW19942.1 hypothetical protein PV08_00517 [Exophiala spinifera]